MLERNPARKVLANRKLKMSQQQPGSRDKQSPGLCEEEHKESVRIPQDLKASSGSRHQEWKSLSLDQNHLAENNLFFLIFFKEDRYKKY